MDLSAVHNSDEISNFLLDFVCIDYDPTFVDRFVVIKAVESGTV